MICDGHTRELERDAMGLLVTHANNGPASLRTPGR